MRDGKPSRLHQILQSYDDNLLSAENTRAVGCFWSRSLTWLGSGNGIYAQYVKIFFDVTGNNALN